MNTVADVIRQEISNHGAISFARFMELALYHQELGYYERRPNRIGRHGDYFTNVSVGTVFGELLAFQFSEWVRGLDSSPATEFTESKQAPLGSSKPPIRENSICRFQIVEAGAHDARLALDILTWLEKFRPALFESIEYWIIEPSKARRQWQQQTLAGYAGKAHWFQSWQDNLPNRVRGVIFTNELLDSFPTHRLGWDQKNRRWFEWGVTRENDRFVWVRMKQTSDELLGESCDSFYRALPDELLAQLPDEFSTEHSTAAGKWWRHAAGALDRGRLVAIDYGLRDEQFFSPERSAGTLRAYHRHRQCPDLLARVGEQDLTSQVNFSAIQKTGEKAGLVTECLMPQPQFLTRIFEKANREPSVFSWTPERIRQFQTLIHPEHLGRSFQVLVQTRLP